MAEPQPEDGDEIPLPGLFGRRSRISTSMTVLAFVFGIAAGVLLAFSGYAVLEETTSVLLTVFLTAIFLITLVGALAYILRRPILRMMFGVATTQLELFSKPINEVAEGAFLRDVQRVTAATRLLVQLTLARYAWMVTRRWIVASLTGLIAAMAALAGTALLFKQNELIASQSALLEEQNAKVALQTDLLIQDVQLAEAARNAEIAVEITNIAQLMGDAMLSAEARAQRAATATGQPIRGGANSFRPVLNPWLDLGKPLLMRITSASRAAKPYRFLAPRLTAHDTSDKLRVAMAARRDDLPTSYAQMSRTWGWTDPPEVDVLIDRPASPERAQLLQVLMSAGLGDYEMLNMFGLDLSFAYATDTDLLNLSMQGAQLSYATFDRAQIIEADFAGAALENTRFRNARLVDVLFRGVPFRAAKAPYTRDEDYLFATALNGADFSGSMLQGVDMSTLNGSAMRLDGAALNGVDFSGSDLSASTFRGAILLDATFDGTALRSVEFDGAYVFREDFLDHLAETAEAGSFVPDRFRLVPATMDDVFRTVIAFSQLTPGQVADVTGSEAVWRVERTRPFEAPEAPVAQP